MASGQNISTDWRRLYPFQSHWMELAGGRMHYLDEGPTCGDDPSGGASLLFVHGNPTWSFHWRRLILALRDRYRCIAPDHLGCGLSNKPRRLQKISDHVSNLCDLIEGLGLDRVTLVAQDWGGAIGLRAMFSMQQRLERIILFNTGAFPPRYIPWRIRACRLPLVGRLAVQGANLFSRAALRMTLARKSRLDRAIAAGYLAPYDSWSNRRAVYGFVKDIPDPRPRIPDVIGADDSTWNSLAALERMLPTFAERPSCLIWGMRDWCFRPDCLERFIEAWPRAEVHRLENVGHWVIEDAADDALDFVRMFLDRTSGDLPPRHVEHEETSAATGEAE